MFVKKGINLTSVIDLLGLSEYVNFPTENLFHWLPQQQPEGKSKEKLRSKEMYGNISGFKQTSNNGKLNSQIQAILWD